MNKELFSIIKDNQDHLIHLYDQKKEIYDEYFRIDEKIQKKEAFLKKLLEQVKPTLAKNAHR